MGYLEEFQTQINRRDFPKFLQLWEEYCTSDPVDIEEFSQLLKAIKTSELAKPFGQIVETAIPMWQTIKDKHDSYLIMKLLIDLELTNSPNLYDIALNLLKQKHGQDPQFEERLRLAGIRNSENFQGALANYDLLAHLAKGKFVFHTGGWGTGEIMDVSFLREQITLEFEHVPGRKHLSLANAFKVLTPLEDESFLARRFGDADNLEKEAKEDPLGVIKLLLHDLGPKTSSELKDELCELVIPEEDWAKWWQSVRGKLKKDTMIEAPKSVRDIFRLRKTEVRHEERLLKEISTKTDPSDIITTAYTFARDIPAVLKDETIRNTLHEKLLLLLAENTLSEGDSLQAHIFLEDFLGHKFPEKTLEKVIQSDLDFEKVIDAIDIIALKKRVLTLVRDYRTDWPEIFLVLLFSNQQGSLREYLCKELLENHSEALTAKLKGLLKYPDSNADMFIWYFQLLLGKEAEKYPFGTKEGVAKWFEGLLILLHILEFKPECRDTTKKIYTLLCGKRYALIRQILEGSTLDFTEEFLLLASKVQMFTESEQKILRSLAAVVHPSVAKKSPYQHPHSDSHTIWTTEAAFLKMQERVRQIGTTEIVANAREIEAARAHGDLRENSEYKFALEKRSRLQGELKSLSDQLGRARIITKMDVIPDEVCVGTIVELTNGKNGTLQYTILGPWDADPDNNILSLQSKFAQAMLGCKKEDKFNFRDEEYQVISLKTIFD